jgi:hypothetical protein
MGSPKWHRELKESEVDELFRKEKKEAERSRRDHPSSPRNTTIEAPEWRNVIPVD